MTKGKAGDYEVAQKSFKRLLNGDTVPRKEMPEDIKLLVWLLKTKRKDLGIILKQLKNF